jgi:hypothetical protein
MRWESSLFSILSEFREEAQQLIKTGDECALCDLYDTYAEESRTAFNAADAVWFMEELLKVFETARHLMLTRLVAA